MKNRNTNRVRKEIAQGANPVFEKKWREQAASGTASAHTIEFLNNLDEECDAGVKKDCLGKCGGTAVEDNTGSCCEEHEIEGGSCFSEGYNLICPQDCTGNCDGYCEENPSGGEFLYYYDCMEKLRQDPKVCDACPDSSESKDTLGTCCDPSEIVPVGTYSEGVSQTLVCGGENQKYYKGEKIDDPSFGYCYPESYSFSHPLPGYKDLGTFDSWSACGEA